MFVIMLAGGVLAGLVAVDVKRYQARERAAMDWCTPPARQKDEHEDGGL